MMATLIGLAGAMTDAVLELAHAALLTVDSDVKVSLTNTRQATALRFAVTDFITAMVCGDMSTQINVMMRVIDQATAAVQIAELNKAGNVQVEQLEDLTSATLSAAIGEIYTTNSVMMETMFQEMGATKIVLKNQGCTVLVALHL